MLGPGAKHSKSIRVLNRVLTSTSPGITYEADQRHADIVIHELGLESAKSVTTPSSREDTDKMLADAGAQLHPTEATKHRALAARLNYLALDIADIQHFFRVKKRYTLQAASHLLPNG